MPREPQCRTCTTRIPSSCSQPVACNRMHNPIVTVPCHKPSPVCSDRSAYTGCGCSSPQHTCCGQTDHQCPPIRCKKGYLLPQIIASGREWLRRCNADLCVQVKDECIEGPFSLINVSAMKDACTWQIMPQPSSRRLLLHVQIPLCCQIRDHHSCIHDGTATLETDVCLFTHHITTQPWQSLIQVLPCVRLSCLPCASDDLCFDAQLEVLVEAYMLHWEPYFPDGRCPELCTELPLYPEPHNHC